MISRINELINYINDISEAKQVGTLYHFTRPFSALSILEKNEISLGIRGYVSLTRNKNFKSSGVDNTLAFVLDGDRLSQNYKIEPYADRAFYGKNKEAEERIDNKITSLSKYLLKILIWKTRFVLHLNIFSAFKDHFIKLLELSDTVSDNEILNSFVQYLNKTYNVRVEVTEDSPDRVNFIHKMIDTQLKSEKYVTTVKSPWAEADIYKDPSPSDISHLIKNSSQSGNSMGFKFVVDLEKEDVYIWDAFTSLHQPVVDKLGIARNNDWKHLAGGNIIRKDGEYTVYWDSLTFRNSKDEIFKAGLLLNLYIKHN